MTDSGTGRVLLVDDDSLVTRTLEMLIRQESSWEVVPFNSPIEALESLPNEIYDVAISDFLMPQMDGIKFLARVKEIQPFASRIILTGYADKQNAIRSINEVGLYYYIEKPWENAALLVQLRNAVERAQLLRDLDAKARQLCERDQAFADLRAKLLKALI